MEQVVTGDSANYEAQFVNSDDPRHDFFVVSLNPSTYYEFRTPIGFRETHTVVRVDLPPSTSPLPSPPLPSRSFPVSSQETCDKLTLFHDLRTTR
jgi:hypothetical protein